MDFQSLVSVFHPCKLIGFAAFSAVATSGIILDLEMEIRQSGNA